WSSIWPFYYDANNHVLYSILSKVSVRVLGLSEFALRLPSLLAGFFLVLGVFCLLQLTRSVAIRWVAFLTICLHPFLLDFSIAARGYSLSVALLVGAFYVSFRGSYVPGGILLGLAASANLAIAFPALGLMLATVLLTPGRATPRLKMLAGMAIPAAVLFS